MLPKIGNRVILAAIKRDSRAYSHLFLETFDFSKFNFVFDVDLISAMVPLDIHTAKNRGRDILE